MKKEAMRPVGVRIPIDIWERVEAEARERGEGWCPSDIIRLALEDRYEEK